jgi:hypothetical protein
MPKGERLATPSSCRISDLLNGMWTFASENPDWLEDQQSMMRMVMARQMLTDMAHPLEVTDEEYEFVENITNFLNQKADENG